jgi:hypothetical protein
MELAYRQAFTRQWVCNFDARRRARLSHVHGRVMNISGRMLMVVTPPSMLTRAHEHGRVYENYKKGPPSVI